MEKIEKLRDWYHDIVFYMGELRDYKQALHDVNELYAKELRAMSLNDNFDDIGEKLKNNENDRQLNDTKINILLQDVLYIQKQLLLHASEIVKNSKYFGKPFGEKTKEKMQNELKQQLMDAMGCTLYCYINRVNDSWDDYYEINIYFEDFYYEYNLKQEYIKIKTEDKEIRDVGYYGEIEFIDFVAEKLEENARAMIDTYNQSMKQVREIEKQLEEIKEKNNQGKCAFLYDLRITEYITKH